MISHTTKVIQTELFENESEIPYTLHNGLTCHTCIHRQRWECGSKTIQY